MNTVENFRMSKVARVKRNDKRREKVK